MASFSVRASLCALFVALALQGCASDEGDGTSGAGGASGASAGAAGVGGATGGAGGATGGAGGMTGGAGGAAGTVSGGAGGAAGTVSGGTGGASGMGGDGVPGCEAAVTGTPADLHAAALEAMVKSCSFGSCHDADGKRAMLILLEGDNLVEKLVDKPACQVPMLSLVKSGGGQPALDGSWIWQKLAAPADDSFNIVANDAWGAPAICGQTQGTYGTRMPMTGLDLSEARMAAIRNWICAGAMAP